MKKGKARYFVGILLLVATFIFIFTIKSNGAIRASDTGNDSSQSIENTTEESRISETVEDQQDGIESSDEESIPFRTLSDGIILFADSPEEVGTWQKFKEVLANPAITHIKLTKGLTATSSASIAARDLLIDGNNQSINFGSYSLQPANTSSTAEVTIKNLTYSGSGNTGSVVASNSGSNWTVNFESIQTTNSSVKIGLADLPNGKVTISGNSYLTIASSTMKTAMVNAGNISVAGTLRFEPQKVIGLFRIQQTNGIMEFLEGTKLTATRITTLIDAASSVNVFARGTQANLASITITQANTILRAGGKIDADWTGVKLTVSNQTGNLFPLDNAANSRVVFNNSVIEATSKDINNFFRIRQPDCIVEFNNSEITHRNTYDNYIKGSFYNIDQTTAVRNSLLFNNTEFTAYSYGEIAETDADGEPTELKYGGNIISVSMDKDPGYEQLIPESRVDNFTLRFNGEKTKAKLKGGSNSGNARAGIINITGHNADFTVDNGAQLDVQSLFPFDASPAICLRSRDGQFSIDHDSLVTLNSIGNTDTLSATLRFRSAGNMLLKMQNNSKLIVTKSNVLSNSAPAIQFMGSQNKVHVLSGAELIVYNKGSYDEDDNERIVDGGANARNQGILYRQNDINDPSLGNEFVLDGIGSSVQIESPMGAAIDNFSGSGSAEAELSIKTGPGTYFIARGKTASQNEAIFRGRKLTFEMDNPRYYDFTNDRVGGGQVFSADANNSIFQSKGSDVAFWEKGTDVNGAPDAQYFLANYQASGLDFQNTDAASDTSVKTYLDQVLKSNKGLKKITRLNANNQTGVITDIHLPTNADQYIWGHIQVPEGRHDEYRDAYVGEAFVTLGVFDKNDVKLFETKGEIIEDTPGSGKVSIYGATATGGTFKAALPDNITKFREHFLEEGWTVKALAAWRGDPDMKPARSHVSTGSDLQAQDQTTIDVTPPKTPVMNNVNPGNSTVSGTSDEDGAAVYVKVNNVWKGQGIVTGGTWSVTLPGSETLALNDVVEAYLQDTAQLDTAAVSFPLPAGYGTGPTGSSKGNQQLDVTQYQNSTTYGQYHDAKYSAAKDLRFYPGTQQTIIFTGALELKEAPTDIDFRSISFNGKTVQVKNPTYNKELKIEDTRTSKTKWYLYAKVTKEMTYQSATPSIADPVLHNSLKYVKQGVPIDLSYNSAQLIFESQATGGDYVVSNEWGGTEGNGLMLEVQPQDITQTGNYQSEILWQLATVPLVGP